MHNYYIITSVIDNYKFHIYLQSLAIERVIIIKFSDKLTYNYNTYTLLVLFVLFFLSTCAHTKRSMTIIIECRSLYNGHVI